MGNVRRYSVFASGTRTILTHLKISMSLMFNISTLSGNAKSTFHHECIFSHFFLVWWSRRERQLLEKKTASSAGDSSFRTAVWASLGQQLKIYPGKQNVPCKHVGDATETQLDRTDKITENTKMLHLPKNKTTKNPSMLQQRCKLRGSMLRSTQNCQILGVNWPKKITCWF